MDWEFNDAHASLRNISPIMIYIVVEGFKVEVQEGDSSRAWLPSRYRKNSKSVPAGSPRLRKMNALQGSGLLLFA
jgi:hypothetical protein